MKFPISCFFSLLYYLCRMTNLPTVKKFLYLLVATALLAVSGCDREPPVLPKPSEPEPVAVESISVSPAPLSIQTGRYQQLTGTILPADAANKAVSWESDAPDVATVSSTGRVTGVSAGQTTIRVTTADGGKTAECVVTVTLPPVRVTDVTLKPAALTLDIGNSETLTATVLPEKADNKNVSWSSDNPSIAAVDDEGNVEAISRGRATITVTTEDGNMTASCTVSVSIADGRATCLQQATDGNGIDIVLMGDGFSEELIADGTYEQRMLMAVEHFFSEEPYTSFRHLFNIWSVDVVSNNDGYIPGEDTALGGWFEGGGSTLVGGDDEKCVEYALNALGRDADLDDVLIVVIMNSTAYAGTCYMYRPEEFPADTGRDWGGGLAVAYFPIINNNMELFRQVLVHECGHGFAKLADEYVNSNSAIPVQVVNQSKFMWRYGWYRNVDYTDDPDQIQWAHFIDDVRYTGRVGIYQGADYYAYGAWRPSENSMMRHNNTHFNAPSREAIYYRIHKLAYGASWQYSYGGFVVWDMPNIASGIARQAAGRYATEQMKPTSPPVTVNKSWKEAFN